MFETVLLFCHGGPCKHSLSLVFTELINTHLFPCQSFARRMRKKNSMDKGKVGNMATVFPTKKTTLSLARVRNYGIVWAQSLTRNNLLIVGELS